jgi:hypothetical protein
MAQSGRNVEMAAGLASNTNSMSNSMSSSTVSGASVVSENMEGNSQAAKMGPDKGGFGNVNKWTPPNQGFAKGTFTGRLGNFGFRGGGSGFSPYGLRGNK